ncbi:hypothetical protein [Streptomyces sp. NPDC057696]|uniref:hypothetical protein n=1 Tax=Streptomyces sp. NPDC057696 TaxID=3346218 RepID=UPI00367CB800
MGLTSRALEYATVLAALVCVALAVRVWPRLARRGPVAVLGRLGVIGATQLTILTAFAVAVNTNFDFYGPWYELLGHVDKAPAEVTALGPSGVHSTEGAVRGGLVQPAGPQGLDRVKGLPHGPAARVGRVEWMSGRLTFPQDTTPSSHHRPTAQAANRPHP